MARFSLVDRLDGRSLRRAMLAVLGVCLPLPDPATAAADPRIEAVNAALEKMVARQEVAGAAAAVVRHDGLVHLDGVGFADVASRRPMTADTICWIASMTKPITGIAILMLQDDGRLHVDDEVVKYVPEFGRLQTPSGHPARLTIKQLLTHTSGLGEATGPAARDARTLADLVPIWLSARMKHEPGEKWTYTQSGINLAGRIVEVVSGRPFDVFLEERLFAPLEMRNTTFYPDGPQRERLATAYARRDDAGTLEPVPSRAEYGDRTRPPQGNGGLYSTARDYARLCRMLLNRGSLDGRRYLGEASVRELASVHTGDLPVGFFQSREFGGHGANYGWGLGTCVLKHPHDGVASMLSPGSFGHGGAWGTQAWIDPVKDAAYVLMVQRSNFANSDASEIRQVFQQAAAESLAAARPPIGYRSPTDLAVSADGRRLVTANAASATASLVDLTAGSVIDEVAIGRRPAAIARRDGSRFVAVAVETGDLVLLDIVADRLRETGRLHVGFEPRSVVVSADGTTAWVPLSASGRLVLVDLRNLKVAGTIDVGPLPTWVALAPDGDTVAVACSGRPEIVLVDVASRAVRERHPFKGLNLGQIAFMPDGRSLHFTFTYDGGSHPSPGNIRRGWVTGSRLGRLRLVDPVGLDGLTLDVPGKAVGDVLGLVVTDAGVVVSAGGTHELLRLATGKLPWRQISGSEVMDAALARDRERFRRLEVGGRPLGLRSAPDGSRIYVANALFDAVQEVDPATFAVVRTIPVDRGHEPSPEAALARRGEEIFHDARRSLDQWYSCHTCHFDGGGNTVTFDTLNDGSSGSYKTVLPLWGVAETGPWTWHGWQTDLRTALRKSLVDSMQGPPPAEDDVTALAAFLATLTPPPSPFREADGRLSAAAIRGRDLFASDRAGCTNCHAGRHFTSPELHDVGLVRSGDRYPGFSPPSLAGGFRKTMFLHHGKAKSLRRVLMDLHSPEKVSGLPPLTDSEADDLVAYLRSL